MGVFVCGSVAGSTRYIPVIGSAVPSDMVFLVKLLTVLLIRSDLYNLILAALLVENQNQTAVTFASDTFALCAAFLHRIIPYHLSSIVIFISSLSFALAEWP